MQISFVLSGECDHIKLIQSNMDIIYNLSRFVLNSPNQLQLNIPSMITFITRYKWYLLFLLMPILKLINKYMNVQISPNGREDYTISLRSTGKGN